MTAVVAYAEDFLHGYQPQNKHPLTKQTMYCQKCFWLISTDQHRTGVTPSTSLTFRATLGVRMSARGIKNTLISPTLIQMSSTLSMNITTGVSEAEALTLHSKVET